jgi:hypothetical protein
MTLLKSVKTFDARLQCAEGKANSTCTVTSSWMRFQSVEANPSPLLSPVFARARIQLAGTVTPNTLSDWQIDDHDLISHGIKTLSKQVNFGHSVLGDTLLFTCLSVPRACPLTHPSLNYWHTSTVYMYGQEGVTSALATVGKVDA